MESSLIRVLPACLVEPLPSGWDVFPETYTLEVMPAVERPEVVPMALQTTEPDILLLDADFADGDVFEAVRLALEARPGLIVILVSSNNSPDRLRRAMLTGAEEYLIRPLEASTLRDSILAITATRELRTIETTAVEETHETAQIKGTVIGVVSGKGGLGKTTVSTNLAALVGKVTRKPVGLVGFEAGDGAVLLSLQPRLGLLDMAGALGSDASSYTPEFLRQYGTPHRNGLMYWTWQGTGTHSGEIPEDFLPNLFDTCRRTCEYSFIDFPLLSEDEVLAVAPLLDIIIVVSSTSDLLALRSTKTFLEILPDELRPRVRVVVNRSDPADMISREDFEASLEHKVTGVLPNDPQLTAQAINMGAPFINTQNQSPLSHELRALAQRLFRIEVATEAVKPKKRLKLF